MTEKSFWSRLFDFSFSSFITLKIIPVLYGLWIAIGVVEAVAILTAGGLRSLVRFGWSGGSVFLSLIWAVVFFFLWVIGGRVWMETIIVLFRIAENTSILVRTGRGERSEGDPETRKVD